MNLWMRVTFVDNIDEPPYEFFSTATFDISNDSLIEELKFESSVSGKNLYSNVL